MRWRSTIEVELHAAPSTPLNLLIGVVYTPRVHATNPVFAGYRVWEAGPDLYAVEGIQRSGRVSELARGGIAEAYVKLATYLGMTS